MNQSDRFDCVGEGVEMKYSWSDWFGSHEAEMPNAPVWHTSVVKEEAEVHISLRDGTPPTIEIEIKSKNGLTFSTLRMSLDVLDEHINTLIKHRDLLAQMNKKE